MKVKCYLSNPTIIKKNGLKEPKTTPCKVRIYIRAKDMSDLVINTDIYFLPADWDNKEQKYIGNYTNADSIRLKSLVAKIEARISNLKMNEKTYDEIAAVLTNEFIKNDSPDGLLLTCILHEATNKTPRTAANYQTLAKHLKAFNSSLLLNEFSKKDFEKFTKYLLERTMKSSAKQYLTTLKVILSQQDSYKSSNYKINIQPDEKAIFRLMPQEIEVLKNIELPENLENTRRLFMLSYFTCQRWSDVAKFKPIGNVWNFRQQKTNAKMSIPLQAEIIELGASIQMQSYRKTSLDIKQIAQLCNFDRLIEVQYTDPSNQKITDYQPLKNLVTFHSARKSGLTFLFTDKKKPASTCMQLSGHRTLQSFWQYVGSMEQLPPTILSPFFE